MAESATRPDGGGVTPAGGRPIRWDEWAVLAWAAALGVIAVAMFAELYVVRSGQAVAGGPVLDGLCRTDGQAYAAIAADGYAHGEHPERIAFFPGYPLLGRAVHATTALPVGVSLLTVSWASFAGTLWVLGRYPGEGRWAAVAAAAWPAGFFCRVAYTESLCLLGVVAAVTVLKRGGPVLLAAVLAGAASGTRSVGLAVLPVVVGHVWVRRTSWRSAAWRVPIYAAVAAWGLLAFAGYQGVRYGNPLAFAKAQDAYRMRPAIPFAARAVKLLTLEPIWAVYRPTSDGFWATLPLQTANPEAMFNSAFWNPIYFVAAVGLVALGGAKRWLDRSELTLAAGLLLIAYVSRGYDFGMCSQGRFTVVCFPIYLVGGRLLAAMPDVWRVSLIVLAAFQMCAWAALFAAGYPIF